jgi:hypothetical protein
MKKLILSILLVWTVVMCHAQVVQENEAAVVYYMPKTELVITLDYEVIEQTPGVFYQYAKRYLGAEDVLTDASKQYVLLQVRTHTEAKADLARAYKVTAQKGISNQSLTLSEDGRLLGYNVGNNAKEKEEHQPMTLPSETSLKLLGDEALMPLLEEQFMAGSVAKMAEGAAKQIYRLRETRLNLLAGDMEHVPADGVAMQLVLDELNKQEQALVELFVGTRIVKRSSYTLRYQPEESVEKEVICRLSQHTGIVDKNDLSGEPIYLTVDATKQDLRRHLVEDNKAPMPSQLYYNLPGSAVIRIEHKGQVMTASEFAVAQWGVAIPLAAELFTKTAPVIHINPQTGNILSIQ